MSQTKYYILAMPVGDVNWAYTCTWLVSVNEVIILKIFLLIRAHLTKEQDRYRILKIITINHLCL